MCGSGLGEEKKWAGVNRPISAELIRENLFNATVEGGQVCDICITEAGDHRAHHWILALAIPVSFGGFYQIILFLACQVRVVGISTITIHAMAASAISTFYFSSGSISPGRNIH